MPKLREASPTPTRTPIPTASTTANATDRPSLTPGAAANISDTDAWIAPVLWLLVILSGIAGTCYVVYRRRQREPQVDGSAHESTTE